MTKTKTSLFKMKLLFLTLSGIADIGQRGIYSDLMRKFVREGHEVYIVMPFEQRKGRSTEMFQSGGANILGVRTLNITKTNVIEKGIGTILLEWQYMAAIKRHLKKVKFDLVLYSTPPITFNKVISWAKSKFGAKSYLMLKDIFPQNAVDLGMFPPKGILHWFFRRKERKLYELSDHIGCMSPANCRYVIEHNPDVDPKKVELCPNSVEIAGLPRSARIDRECDAHSDDGEAIRQQYGIPTDKVLSIYGGNLGKPQGVDFLIEVVQSNERRERSFILIVGSGTEFGKLQLWFNSHSPKNAKLVSALPKQDFDTLMCSADVGLIFLDRRFTIPNYPSRLLSYLENRIPIMMAVDLNTDIGTLAEANGYGLWAESGDLAAFDMKFDTVLGSSALRDQMGTRGYAYLLENYTIDHTYEAILKHYSKR